MDATIIQSKNTILTSLYSSSELQEVMLKIKPDHIRDDVKQHVFLSLFEKDEAFIIDLFERGKLRPYVVKTIYNTANFSEGSFRRQNRRKTEIPTESFPCTPDTESESYDYEELVATCAIRTDQLYWYNRDLLKLYVKHGTYRKVAELTGIPLLSVHDAVKKAKKEVRRMLWE